MHYLFMKGKQMYQSVKIFSICSVILLFFLVPSIRQKIFNKDENSTESYIGLPNENDKKLTNKTQTLKESTPISIKTTGEADTSHKTTNEELVPPTGKIPKSRAEDLIQYKAEADKKRNAFFESKRLTDSQKEAVEQMDEWMRQSNITVIQQGFKTNELSVKLAQIRSEYNRNMVSVLGTENLADYEQLQRQLSTELLQKTGAPLRERSNTESP